MRRLVADGRQPAACLPGSEKIFDPLAADNGGAADDRGGRACPSRPPGTDADAAAPKRVPAATATRFSTAQSGAGMMALVRKTQ